MSSLSKKRGIWYLWITINGKRKGISLGTKSRKLAEILAKNIQESKQSKGDDSNIKLNDLIKLWKNWHSHFSPHYISTVELMMKLFIRSVGDVSIKDIFPEVLIHYYHQLKKSNYSDSYIHNRLKSLRTLFNWAVKNNLLSKSPFTNQVYIPKETSRIEFLTKNEIQKLVKSASEKPRKFRIKKD